MEYLFILLAVVCIAGQFSFTKLYQGAVGQNLLTTLVMLTGTSTVGTLVFFFASGCKLEYTTVSLLLSIASGLITVPYYLIGIKVLSLGSLAIYSMFMMLGGMLVPFFYGITFLHETISVGKVIGTVLLTVFIVLQAVWQKSPDEKEGKGKDGRLFFTLCLIIFFINGLTGVVTKAHSVSKGAVDARSFTTTGCIVTALVSVTLLSVLCLKNKAAAVPVLKKAFKGRSLLYIFLLGAISYTGSFLLIMSASKVPASVQYPIVSGGAIVISALVSAFIFREGLSKKEWISVAGAFASTFLYMF